jgi:hypothetical protein
MALHVPAGVCANSGVGTCRRGVGTRINDYAFQIVSGIVSIIDHLHYGSSALIVNDMAMHRRAFSPKIFLSTVGVGREMLFFRKGQTIYAQRDGADSLLSFKREG